MAEEQNKTSDDLGKIATVKKNNILKNKKK
jgi:hypothetical protein